MSTFNTTLVEYCETAAYYNKIIYWQRQHEPYLNVIISLTMVFWIVSLAQRCYDMCFPVADAEERPMDKKQLRNELVKIEHAIAALNDHRISIMLKLKRD
jgi:hypothetical protein